MKFKNLADVIFVTSDKEKVEAEIIASYESVSGRTLAVGDPVRLFLLVITNIIILLLNSINETGKQNLLRYAAGNNLDHKGLEMGVKRNQATAAQTTIKIILSAPLGTTTTIPAGIRFSAGDNVYFALDAPVIIPAGQTEKTGLATCLNVGVIGNDYLPGQIKTLVDPQPYVASITNTTKSEGGADRQSDDSYREDIRRAPEKFSTAGPTGAYEYFAKHASSNIIDACIYSPKPGTVEIRPLLINGEIPEEETLKLVREACNDRRVRPLTDQVVVKAPEQVKYNIELTYYIDAANTTQSDAIQSAAKAAVDRYIVWQKEKLGRDINPSELIAQLMQTGVKRVEVKSPVFTKLENIQIAKEEHVMVTLGGYENG